MELGVRFLGKVRLPDDCWEWLGYRTEAGYGKLQENGKLRPAHQVAYRLFVGEIPDGWEIDHLCENPSCVNPCHLEPVPHIVNIRRSSKHAANRTHCPQGHPFNAINTYIEKDPKTGKFRKRRCRTCNSKRFRRYEARRKERAAS